MSGIPPASGAGGNEPRILPTGRVIPTEAPNASRTDRVDFGTGRNLESGQVANIVLDRAFEQLRDVVGEAAAALGVENLSGFDTSPEATATRITDFALGFFDRFAENNGLQDNEEGRQAFVDFIGGAIGQGIEEARGILGALNALNPGATQQIDDTASIIDSRLDTFVREGLGGLV